VVHPAPVAHPLKRESDHQLYCQFGGEKEFLLVDQEKDFPSWSEIGLRSDIAVLLNVREMDYAATPQLKDLKRLYIAKLAPGDCLYVPAGWIHQQTALDKDHSLEIRFKSRDDILEASTCQMKLSKVKRLVAQLDVQR